MNELIREEELRKTGLSAEELLIKFKEQLLRDFEMSGAIEYLEPLEDSFDHIQHNLIQALDRVSSSGYSKLQQLLYRIDISEKQLHEAMNENGNKTRHEILATLIIKRVLQKVILKVIYSK
ncbi:MAG: hypothetical protein K0S32_2286 [Bacteroidetes bacterium]|jgi:hypothetical protein|nr:hypothetical protein [Bacteroidota bacterium]